MNTISDTARQNGNYVSLAKNVNINPNGTIQLRDGKQQVSDKSIRYLWQSPLHKDVFGLFENFWCVVNPFDWTVKRLTHIGDAPLYHTLVNNRVVVAGKAGLFEYDGHKARPLTIATPAPPMAQGTNYDMPLNELAGLDKSTHKARTRVIAISYLVGEKEGGLSNVVKIDADSISLTLPTVFDEWVTAINVYSTEQGGSELKLLATVPKDTTQYSFDDGAILGNPATTEHLDPMSTGKYLALWRGRLVVARSNVLYFSQALTYHLTDERFDYIALPQRISFVEVVDGGIWVGQTTGVIFLSGTSIDELSVSPKAVQAPIEGSSIQVSSDVAGELSSGGANVALWLSANGYCIGTADGQVVEYHANILDGIAGVGNTAVVGQRVLSVLHQ